MVGMEATEIQEFSKQMKEGGEESLMSISLAISILAVLVAIVTVLGHRSHTMAVLMKAREGDQWSQYEAKKNRQESMQLNVDMLQLQPTSDPQARAQKLEEYRAHLAKWKDELPQEQEKAEGMEHQVELAEIRAGRFDLGEALLQIAVVLSSITLFTRRRSYFICGLALGVVGALVAGSAWLVR
jgi:hypothetical protein